MTNYCVLEEFRRLFEGTKYRHRDSSLGNRIARQLYEDLYEHGDSPTLRKRIDNCESVLSMDLERPGFRARRADGTFGELMPGVAAARKNGFAVARGPVVRVEIGIAVKILAKAMIKQLGRVQNDLRNRAARFNRHASAPISIAILGINRAEYCVS